MRWPEAPRIEARLPARHQFPGRSANDLIEAQEFEDYRDDDNHPDDIEYVVAHDT
jgi:hypothetical protein